MYLKPSFLNDSKGYWGKNPMFTIYTQPFANFMQKLKWQQIITMLIFIECYYLPSTVNEH